MGSLLQQQRGDRDGAELQFGVPVTHVKLANLLEEPAGETLTVDAEGCVALQVPPKRIITLRLDFAQGD